MLPVPTVAPAQASPPPPGDLAPRLLPPRCGPAAPAAPAYCTRPLVPRRSAFLHGWELGQRLLNQAGAAGAVPRRLRRAAKRGGQTVREPQVAVQRPVKSARPSSADLAEPR